MQVHDAIKRCALLENNNSNEILLFHCISEVRKTRTITHTGHYKIFPMLINGTQIIKKLIEHSMSLFHTPKRRLQQFYDNFTKDMA